MPDRELLDGDTVFRVISRAGDIDKATGKPNANAFMRRKLGDPSGISVFYDCEPEEAGSVLKSVKLVAPLLVGHIRQITSSDGTIRLDVKPNGQVLGLPHANIVGTPYESDDPLMFNFFARRLAEAAAANLTNRPPQM